MAHSADCQIANLGTIYDAPKQAFGKKFCGEAYAKLQWPEIVVLPSKDWNSEKDLTLSLASPSNDRLRALWGTKTEGRIRLEARIEGVEACFAAETSDARFACTPVRHPITLVATRMEPVE